MATKRSASGPRSKKPATKKPATKKPATRKPAARKPAKKPAAPRKPPIAPELAQSMLDRISAMHPDAHCELDHVGPFQLLVSVVLSAQTTDVAVNKLTPELFARYPTPAALATANAKDVEHIINRIGFFRQKTKSIIGLSKKLVENHQGEVPRTLAELVKLPGVGRKTANVVLGVAFGAPEGVVVDTHVQRLSQRLGWTKQTEPEGIEQDLMQLFPKDRWDPLAHALIFHGRRVCAALKPECDKCAVSDVCPSAFEAVKVGRKPPRKRPRLAPARKR